MKERMLAGEPYIADDPEIIADLDRAARLMERFNTSPAADPAGPARGPARTARRGGRGRLVRPPLYCDYGWQIRIGPRSFVNFNAVFLDVARITIGADVQIGPNVQLLTPTHPVEPGAAPRQVGGGQADHHRRQRLARRRRDRARRRHHRREHRRRRGRRGDQGPAGERGRRR